MIKTTMGYPSADGERLLLDRRANRTAQTPTVEQVVDADQVRALQQVPEGVDVDPRLRDYMVTLARRTRRDDRVHVGVSPRGIQKLFEASRAAAAIDGRSYVVPDDVKRVVGPVFTHRIVLTADASVRGVGRYDVVHDVVESVEVPAVGQQHEAASGSS
jgi:MoxR-like ATPase